VHAFLLLVCPKLDSRLTKKKKKGQAELQGALGTLWQRLSLRKRLRVLSGSKKGPDKRNEIVKCRGETVSLKFLREFWRDVKEGKRAAGVELFELLEDGQDVKAASAAQLADFSTFEDEEEGAVLVRVPFRREVIGVGKDQIAPKPREE